MKFLNQKVGKKKNFSIFEIFIVLTIVSLFIALCLVILNEYQTRARDAQRLSGLKEMRSAVELYRLDNGKYPTGDNWGGVFYEENSYSWESLMHMLDKYLIGQVSDPLSNARHQYHFYSDGVDYKIRVILEKPTSGLVDPRFSVVSHYIQEGSVFNKPENCKIGTDTDPSYVKAIYTEGGACFGGGSWDLTKGP